jgi:hypothetical protein
VTDFATISAAFYQLMSILLKQDVLWFRGHQPPASKLAHLAEKK